MRVEGARQTAPSTNGGNFDEVVIPHLDAAYRLARWLMRNEHDAEDAVQEASLRAFRYFRTFTGGNGRAWFLRIVRNTCRGHRGHAAHATTESFDEEQHSPGQSASNPEALALQVLDVTLVGRALNDLPERFRQLIVGRELEGLSYRELTVVLGIPIGTVMSSLSRARQALRTALEDQVRQSGTSATIPVGQEVAHEGAFRDTGPDAGASHRDRRRRGPAARVRARKARYPVGRMDRAARETTHSPCECADLS